MSNPSYDNIDKWLFEYTEGNLSPNQVSQLELFLFQNPELDQDLDAWQNATVDATPVVYPHINAHTRKPIAWLTSSLLISGVIASSAFAWLAYSSIDETITANDSAHTVNLTQVSNSIQKAGTYFEAKKKSEQPNYVLDLSGFTFPVYNQGWNYFMPGCAGNAGDISNSGFYSIYDNGPFVNENINPLASTDKNVIAGLENITDSADKPFGSNNEFISDDSNSEESIKNAKAMSRTENKFSSNYNKSLTSKFKSIVRKVIRMTDNPIALTNSKDIYYHTPGMQTLDVNFGSVGSLLTTRVQTLSRAQWTGHSNQQFANQISFDSYVKNIRGGIGVQLNHVYYGNGEYQVGQFGLTYSPKFAVSKNVVIEPAIRFKMGNKRLFNQKMIPGQLVELDRQNLRTYESESPTATSQDLWYKDVGLALMSNTKWFSAGIQIDNLGKHYSNAFNSTDGKDRQGQHLTATIGTDYVSRTKLISFSPYIMYQKVENLSEIWGGSIFRYKKFTIGGGVSSLGDYAASIGIKTNRLMITYAVDNTQSLLLNKKLLSQQLTLRILTNRGGNTHRMLNL